MAKVNIVEQQMRLGNAGRLHQQQHQHTLTWHTVKCGWPCFRIVFKACNRERDDDMRVRDAKPPPLHADLPWYQ